MTTSKPDAEADLEEATPALFRELGWRTVDAFGEVYGEVRGAQGSGPCLGCATHAEVILRPRVQEALTCLNPGLPPEACDAALAELSRDRSAMTLADANREIYALLREGMPVMYRDPDGEEQFERMIEDWNRGASDVEIFFRQLVAFAQQLNREEQRHIDKNLTEEELAVFDLLARPGMQLMSKQEREHAPTRTKLPF